MKNRKISAHKSDSGITMPRGSKKRKAEAKKKQENRPNNHSPSSTGSNAVNKEDTKRSDERQSDVVRVEKEPRIEESMKPSGMNGEPTGKSDNGGGSSSSSSGNSSDDEVSGTKSSLTAEDISSVEEMENVQSDSEKIPLLVEKVKNESLLEDNEKSPNKVGDKVGTTVRNKEGVVQSDNRAEQEKDSTVTEPLLVPEEKTSWRSCCGLFEVFSGSGR